MKNVESFSLVVITTLFTLIGIFAYQDMIKRSFANHINDSCHKLEAHVKEIIAYRNDHPDSGPFDAMVVTNSFIKSEKDQAIEFYNGYKIPFVVDTTIDDRRDLFVNVTFDIYMKGTNREAYLAEFIKDCQNGRYDAFKF